MTRYIPASAASALSAALWTLARPDAANESTQFLFGWVDDLKGTRWLVVDTEYEIDIHPDALSDGLLPTPILLILASFIDAGQLPKTTDDDLTDLVVAHLGKRMNVYDAFPQLFKDMSKTREEMIAAGLLPEHQMPWPCFPSPNKTL